MKIPSSTIVRKISLTSFFIFSFFAVPFISYATLCSVNGLGEMARLYLIINILLSICCLVFLGYKKHWLGVFIGTMIASVLVLQFYGLFTMAENIHIQSFAFYDLVNISFSLIPFQAFLFYLLIIMSIVFLVLYFSKKDEKYRELLKQRLIGLSVLVLMSTPFFVVANAMEQTCAVFPSDIISFIAPA